MEIREVHEEMISAIKEFLADREGFRDANGWTGLFNYSWKLPNFPYGYAIMDQDKIVAFVGTIFSQRIIEGQPRICCNMNTWFVLEEYRPQMLGIKILRPFIKMEDVLITALSPAELTVTVLERLGFKLLDHEQIAVPVAPGILFRNSKASEPLVMFEPAEIEQYLNDEDRTICRDHATLACEHLLIRENTTGKYCYIVATTAPFRKLRWLKKKWLNFCYVSSSELFVKHFARIRKHLWKRGFLAICYDTRLLPGAISQISLKRKKKRQYRWKDGALGRVDNLYSELVTFNKY